jgi:hypothetical protein
MPVNAQFCMIVMLQISNNQDSSTLKGTEKTDRTNQSLTKQSITTIAAALTKMSEHRSYLTEISIITILNLKLNSTTNVVFIHFY